MSDAVAPDSRRRRARQAPSENTGAVAEAADTFSRVEVFIGNLVDGYTKSSVTELVSPFGVVHKVLLKRNGAAVVAFDSESSATRAIAGLRTADPELRVEYAKISASKPRTRKAAEPAAPPQEAGGSRASEERAPSALAVFVGNLPDVSDEDIRSLFERHGAVSSVRISSSRKFGTITFEQPAAAAAAIAALHNMSLGGSVLRVEAGRGRPKKNRSGGGGGGGGGRGAPRAPRAAAAAASTELNPCKVFVGNLPEDGASEADLSSLFAPYGAVESATFGRNNRYAFAVLSSAAAAAGAVAHLNGVSFRGSALKVELEHSKTPKPRAVHEFDPTKVWMGNIPATVKVADVQAAFPSAGRIFLKRGYAYVSFPSEGDADAVVQRNGETIWGQAIVIELAKASQ